MDVPERLTTLIIWQHGVDYLDEILDMAYCHYQLRVIRVIRLMQVDCSKFIRFVYKNDKVNPIHLYYKTKYLSSLSGPIYIVVVSEKFPDYFLEGENKSILQSAVISRFKNDVRNIYNPKSIDGSMSHDHVIHATDDEDDALRVWTRYDRSYASSLPYYTLSSLHFPRKDLYEKGLEAMCDDKDSLLTQLSIGELYAKLTYSSKSERNQVVPIRDTPHYKFASGNVEEYMEYISLNRGLDHKCYYSERKFRSVIEYVMEHENVEPIWVAEVDGRMVVTDGLHRAASLLYKGKLFISCYVRR